MSRTIETIKVTGAVCAILVTGALVGAGTLWNTLRINAVDQSQQVTVNDLNQKVLPEIKKKLDELAVAQQDQKTLKK